MKHRKLIEKISDLKKLINMNSETGYCNAYKSANKEKSRLLINQLSK